MIAGDYAVTGSVTVTVGPCRLTVGAEGESTQKVIAQKPLSDFKPATKCCKIIDDKTNGNTLTVIKNSWTLLDVEHVGAVVCTDASLKIVAACEAKVSSEVARRLWHNRDRHGAYTWMRGQHAQTLSRCGEAA